MNRMTIRTVIAGVSAMAALAACAKPSSGKISATLFDGQGNKEVLAEATYVPREPAPAPQAAPVQQPQTTSSTLSDGKGRVLRTVEQKGNTTTVKDGRGNVISSTTKNADGSTVTRDGHGLVRTTTGDKNAK